MPDEKDNNAAKIKVKKTKKRAVRKKARPPLGLNADSGMKILMPEAGFKIKESAPVARRGEAKSVYRKIAFSFVVLTLILAAVVFYFGFSKLTVVIIPAQEKISDSLTAEVVNQSGNSTPVAGQIYGVVKEVPVEQTRDFPASGKEILGEEVAGKVIIVNNYVKNQPLVATTRLLSADNKLFRLRNTVNVPAGGQVTAEIYADEPSQDMAVGPTKFTIPGLWAGIQDKIYAQSQETMKYSEKVKYVVKQSDIDNAVNLLRSDLLTNAKEQVSRAYKDYAQAIFAVDNNSVSQEVQGKVGEEKEKFSVKMKIMVEVVAFNDDEIYKQAKLKLESSLADDKEISEFNKQDISYNLDSYNTEQGTATITVNSTAKTTLKDGTKAINRNNLAGLDYAQLKTYLSGLPEVAGYQINFFPSFMKKAPNLVDRIEIKIKK